MRISVELVPRDLESLRAEADAVHANLPSVNMINIPDVLRFPVRSWVGCAHAATGCPNFARAVPHLRAIDINPNAPLPMRGFLTENSIDTILIVTGDAPADLSHRVYPTNSLDIIRRFKTELPDVKVYAAIDPYRSSLREELEYAERKLTAGADGFFTQPFFDLRLLGVWADLLPGIEIFWGITPVTSGRSRGYWETRNRAVFPKTFRPTLESNREFAKEALETIRAQNGAVYFMPIKVDAVEYLQGIV